MSFIYRLKQKLKYHLTTTEFNKRVAEINRFQQIITVKRSVFSIRGCPLLFNEKQHLFLLNNIDLFRNLTEQKHLNFTLENETLICNISGGIIRLPVTTAEELFIIQEIWVDGCYNVQLTTSQPIVVIDVGMNVGFASLFFASLKQVSSVYSFEPFIPTFEQGMTNLKLNSGLSSKIKPHNFGLSLRETELTVDYSIQHRGRTGIWGTELILDKTEHVSKERLILKSFNHTIKNIIENHPNSEFIWKIDCEGSEYDIFQAVDNFSLKSVRAILLEWHKKGPKQLIDKLIENRFTILSTKPNSNKVGMIYAFR